MGLFLSAAQKDKREPLTGAQIEEIREAGIYPDERIKLYTKYLNEHADAIKGLTVRAKSAARSSRLDDELQDFTALMDEMGSNLDVYFDRKGRFAQSAQAAARVRAGHWLAICAHCPASRGSTWREKKPSRAPRTLPTRPRGC